MHFLTAIYLFISGGNLCSFYNLGYITKYCANANALAPVMGVVEASPALGNGVLPAVFFLINTYWTVIFRILNNIFNFYTVTRLI